MGLMPVTPRESLLPLELEEALEQRCAVLMEYLDARQNRTHRVIEPVGVRRRNGELLLIAHCHMRNDRRTFKLDRIVQLTRTAPATAATAAPAPSSPVSNPSPPAMVAPPPRLGARIYDDPRPREGLSLSADPVAHAG
jgi:predicted DNA-binding transcriptional regulator YafY